MSIEKLVCPLRHVVTKRNNSNYNPIVIVKAEFQVCYQEKCAWWIPTQQCCAIFALNRGVTDISNTLERGLYKEDDIDG